MATARIRAGPVAVTPSVSLSNVGIDTNVFNAWTDPKTDFTATITPQADAWLRAGRARLTVHGSLSYVYFATYRHERAVNTDDSIRLDLPFRRIRPYVGYSYLNIRERPGFEIDTRARRSEDVFFGGVDLPLTRKFTLGASWRTTRTAFRADEQFNNTYLRDVFNRRTSILTGSVRYALTPLTTLVLQAETVRERFEFSPVRDSDSVRILPGVEFNAAALVNGTARVGYRRFNMRSPGMPDYSGPIASVDVGYSLLGVTRFALSVSRDVAYSYEIQSPYYVATGIAATVTQHVGGPWSVLARGGRQRLAYHDAQSAPGMTPPQQNRTDTVRFYGGGVGYRVSPNARLGFNVDYYTRESPVVLHNYRSLRAGTSVTYGF